MSYDAITARSMKQNATLPWVIGYLTVHVSSNLPRQGIGTVIRYMCSNCKLMAVAVPPVSTDGQRRITSSI